MNAIQRDREIASGTTRGKWTRSPRFKDQDGFPQDVESGTARVARFVHWQDAEHIVRLHNRQPLYDDLIDAVAAIDRVFATTVAKDMPPTIGPDLLWALIRAYASLNREEP